MTTEQIKVGHTHETKGKRAWLVESIDGGLVRASLGKLKSQESVAEFAAYAVRDITPAPESDQGEKVAQATNAAACGGDREAHLSRLVKIAAEMIRCDGLRDPDDEGFRPLGKVAVRALLRRSVRTGNAIAAAVSEIRKQQKATPPTAAVNAELLEALRAIVRHQDAMGGSMAALSATRRIAADAIARAEANR